MRSPNYLMESLPLSNGMIQVCHVYIRVYFIYNGNQFCERRNEGFYVQITSLKVANPQLKVLLSVGGATAGSADFSEMVNNATLRNSFVNQSLEFLITNKMDGLDLDWEYPSSILILLFHYYL